MNKPNLIIPEGKFVMAFMIDGQIYARSTELKNLKDPEEYEIYQMLGSVYRTLGFIEGKNLGKWKNEFDAFEKLSSGVPVQPKTEGV